MLNYWNIIIDDHSFDSIIDVTINRQDHDRTNEERNWSVMGMMIRNGKFLFSTSLKIIRLVCLVVSCRVLYYM